MPEAMVRSPQDGQMVPPIFSERSRSLYVVVRQSVGLTVCNVRAPYSGDCNFRQCFYAV